MDNKNKGSYSTILNAQDMQLKFNEVNSYKIFSGTTGIACMNTNRKFIGIELEEKYFDIAKERIEEVNN